MLRTNYSKSTNKNIQQHVVLFVFFFVFYLDFKLTFSCQNYSPTTLNDFSNAIAWTCRCLMNDYSILRLFLKKNLQFQLTCSKSWLLSLSPENKQIHCRNTSIWTLKNILPFTKHSFALPQKKLNMTHNMLYF